MRGITLSYRLGTLTLRSISTGFLSRSMSSTGPPLNMPGHCFDFGMDDMRSIEKCRVGAS